MRSLSTAPGCLRLATGGVPILTVRGCGPWHGDAYLLFPLPFADWPELDRERWQAARAPADFLEDPKLASGWSPARRRIVEQAYGQFLASSIATAPSTRSAPPGERATETRLRDFLLELRARVTPVSAAMTTGALLRILSALDPGRDWTGLAKAYNHLRRTAAPSRTSWPAW